MASAGTGDAVGAIRTKLRPVVSALRLESPIAREMLAECLGTFLLLVIGNGSVAQSVLSRQANGTFISINWAYGLGVTMAVYVTGSVSGAHINPAVSLAFTAFGKLPLYKLPLYVLAQMVGAFVSGAAVYSVYIEALNAFDGGVRQVMGVNGTGGIFATYPQDYLTIGGGLWDQIFATALLVGIIFAVTDGKNNNITSGLTPIIIGLLVFTIGLSFGVNCGYAINPARDFGPRLFTACAGWGSGVFTEPNGMHWWWVPIIGPCTGGLFGAAIYNLMVGMHLGKPKEVFIPSDGSKDEEKNIFVGEEVKTDEPDPEHTKL